MDPLYCNRLQPKSTLYKSIRQSSCQAEQDLGILLSILSLRMLVCRVVGLGRILVLQVLGEFFFSDGCVSQKLMHFCPPGVNCVTTAL